MPRHPIRLIPLGSLLSAVLLAVLLAPSAIYVAAQSPADPLEPPASRLFPNATMPLPSSANSVTHNPAQPYTYHPPQIPLDANKYPIAPPELELAQVHVYVRHGERTPVGVRLAPFIPEHWVMCTAGRQHDSQVISGSNGNDRLRTRRVVERKDGLPAEGLCLLGELTDIGRKSTYNYGAALRSLYIDRLGFLNDLLMTPGEVYFRSTNMPRTIESLEQVIHGLYPPSKYAENATPALLVRNGRDENLLGNTMSCKRLEYLQVGFAQAAAAAYNQTLEPLDKFVSKYIDGRPIRVDGRPRASGVMDTIRAAIAQGVKVPPEFEDKAIVDVIEQAILAEWFADKTPEVRRLGMGPLLSDLSRKMQQKAEEGTENPLKLLVHSTHDTALAAMCSTLDVFDDKWPAFTASITFELFKKSPSAQRQVQQSYLDTVMSPFKITPPAEYFVRMRYQNKNMALPLCSEEGKHLPGSPEFCTLVAFSARVKELTPIDWDSECAAN